MPPSVEIGDSGYVLKILYIMHLQSIDSRLFERLLEVEWRLFRWASISQISWFDLWSVGYKWRRWTQETNSLRSLPSCCSLPIEFVVILLTHRHCSWKSYVSIGLHILTIICLEPFTLSPTIIIYHAFYFTECLLILVSCLTLGMEPYNSSYCN